MRPVQQHQQTTTLSHISDGKCPWDRLSCFETANSFLLDACTQYLVSHYVFIFDAYAVRIRTGHQMPIDMLEIIVAMLASSTGRPITDEIKIDKNKLIE